MKFVKQYFPFAGQIDRSGEPLCNRVSLLPEVPSSTTITTAWNAPYTRTLQVRTRLSSIDFDLEMNCIID